MIKAPYEPQVNRTYAEMAAHYDTAILPARPRRPRDKAKVEAAVLIIERWLLGRLRHRRFSSWPNSTARSASCYRSLTRADPPPWVTRRTCSSSIGRSEAVAGGAL